MWSGEREAQHACVCVCVGVGVCVLAREETGEKVRDVVKRRKEKWKRKEAKKRNEMCVCTCIYSI